MEEDIEDNDYERARQERIRRNKEFMQAMDLKSPVVSKQPDKPKKLRTPSAASSTADTPRRRSSRVRPQVDFRALETQFDSDEEFSEHSDMSDEERQQRKRKRKADDDDEFQSGAEDEESDDSFDGGVRDDLEGTPRRKKSVKASLSEDSGVSIPFVPNSAVQQDIESSSQCHSCKQWTAKPKAKCRNPGCGLQFCRVCLPKYAERYTDCAKDTDWICPACRLVCQCAEHMSLRIAKLTKMSGPVSLLATQQPQQQSKSTAPPAGTLPLSEDSSDEESYESDDDSDDDGTYYVEKIVDKRMNPTSKKLEYHCKFVGWGDSANMWLSIDVLRPTCEDLIESFMKNVEVARAKPSATGTKPHAIKMFATVSH
eukprot:TRINITY_DN8047_c0_g1_i1.p1 TRINITY_DN8047_c0_g1~~TRINITY_DN8047_c0_g1_i1.p1  ORF type:complete len:382 (+),score=54.40 TRINITY_DN8047_c0_g1_i1:38-1147(+)